jgi:hypothetical protein
MKRRYKRGVDRISDRRNFVVYSVVSFGGLLFFVFFLLFGYFVVVVVVVVFSAHFILDSLARSLPVEWLYSLDLFLL